MTPRVVYVLGPLTLETATYYTASGKAAACVTEVRAIMRLGQHAPTPRCIRFYGDTIKPRGIYIECEVFGRGSIKWRHPGGSWSSWFPSWSAMQRVVKHFKDAKVERFYARIEEVIE